MDVFVLNKENSVANQFLIELRDKNIQQDRMRFRQNLTRLGEVMAYEISKKLAYHQVVVETPLKATQALAIKQQPVLITVLRAGLPYFQGFLNYFDQADSGFIGAYRKEGEQELTIQLDYLAAPSLQNREVILIDPMLATGNSVIRSVAALLKHDKPSHIYVASLVAAPEGVKNINEHLSVASSLFTVSMDENLNSEFYIVPGLGDAGDLSFGEKI
ncbi:MAG: uracil phosphoribosyltransferase [Cyclobacteriaceae bacterium]|jgi:uracil phosphoribosyltransferase|nr:uracil phosphoribosyltransferase [Flammeovirgaceae bacterium]